MPDQPSPEAARAARLREQIDKQIKGSDRGTDTVEPKQPPSPREFIERRMRELDRKE